MKEEKKAKQNHPTIVNTLLKVILPNFQIVSHKNQLSLQLPGTVFIQRKTARMILSNINLGTSLGIMELVSSIQLSNKF